MVGFIKNLFRSKSSIEESTSEPKPKPAPKPPKPPAAPRSNGAYFLDADAAKTFGDLDYMRLSKSVRRTFSKKKLGESNESIRLISSLQSTSGTTPTTVTGSLGAVQNGSNTQAERRRADSSMDMFRNMAREIKKG